MEMPAITELPSAPATAASPAVEGDARKVEGEKWQVLEPQPIREEQVDNAVKFLAHPKVKGSPVVYRRSFLERKGLTREEIDEAFRRVPDPPSDASATTVPAAGGTVSAGQLTQPGGGPVVHPVQVQVAPRRTSWTQLIIALGVLSAAGAGAGVLSKKYFIPKLKAWILDVVSGRNGNGNSKQIAEKNPVVEATSAAAAAAGAAATAATEMAAAMRELAKFRSEDSARLETITRAIDAQTQELKNNLTKMRDSLQSPELTKYQRSVTNTFQANGGQVKGVRSTSESQAVSAKASNFGYAADTPGLPQTGPGHDGLVDGVSFSSNGSIDAPHSQSYLDVVAMLERGEKPPGIREIDDKPPNPHQAPTNPRLQPRLKPWEKPAGEGRPLTPISRGDAGRYISSWNAGGGAAVQPVVDIESTIIGSGGGSSEPWWRRKADAEERFNSSSVKITDVSTEVDIGTVPVGQFNPSSSAGPSGGGRSGWKPPEVPLPIYPGAEEAIRRPNLKSLSSSSATVAAAATPGETALRSIPTSSGRESPADTSTSPPSGGFSQPEAGNDDSIQSDGGSPEQRAEVPDEQDSDYLERSLVDPNRSFKDVVQEGDE